MRLRNEHIAIGAGLLLLLLWPLSFEKRLLNALSSFIPSVEGFRSTPYWDVSRYSWGYGTAAPGSTGTITRERAFADMVSHLLADLERLKNRVTRSLSVNQWAAYLSFAYNAGIANAYNLLVNINAGNDAALATQWRKYIYAGGEVNDTLIERREKELALWFA